MREVADILFGAAFTVAVSVALGSLLLARLRLTFHRWEATLFEFVAGAGCLSFLTALLCILNVGRKGVFLWGGLAVIAFAAVAGQGRYPTEESPGCLPDLDDRFLSYL